MGGHMPVYPPINGPPSAISPRLLHENCKPCRQRPAMRNPILPTVARPFPLPDRILSDGWWLIERAAPPEDELRHWVIAKEEGAIERDRSQSADGRFVART